MSLKQTNQWFKRLYRIGKIIRSQSFQVHWEISRNLKARYAVVIPNSVIQKAVHRNLVRRRILAVIKELSNEESRIQCVILVRQSIERSSMKSIQQELAPLFNEVMRKS